MTSRKKWEHRKAALGLCTRCGKRPSGEYKQCATCRAETAARRRKIRAEGKCDLCEKPTTGSVCPECRPKYKEAKKRYMDKLIKEGMCYMCGHMTDEYGKICPSCLENQRIRNFINRI